jgi:hypothetical protein
MHSCEHCNEFSGSRTKGNVSTSLITPKFRMGSCIMERANDYIWINYYSAVELTFPIMKHQFVSYTFVADNCCLCVSLVFLTFISDLLGLLLA